MIKTCLLCLALSAVALSAAEPQGLTLDLGDGVRMDLVLVPAGEFQMGSPEAEKERQEAETPVHTVRIGKAFYMGKCEVTNAQFRAFRPDHQEQYRAPDLQAGAPFFGDDQPALWVSWYDADAFCRWLSKKTGKTVRLPTEAEWEYACRAGTTTRFHSGDRATLKDSADLARAGWYGANSKDLSHPVGQLAANAFGLHDMHGNAWEWCQDWYAADYYKDSPAADPPGPQQGRAKVLRGGSYLFWTTYYCRSGARYACRPDARESVTGFRVVVETGPARQRPEPAYAQPWPPPRQIPPPFQPADEKEAQVARRFGPPVLTIVQADAPRIDGRLDEAAWKQARPAAFRFLNGRAGAPEAPTLARALCDGKSLYFGFECAEPDMARLKVAGSQRDQNVQAGDCVGVLLDVGHEESFASCLSVAVNPAGVTRDCRGYEGAWTPGRYGTGAGGEVVPEGAAADASWNPKLTVATQHGQAGWSVEMALPLAELGVKEGQVPTVIGLNLVRLRPEIVSRRYGKPRLGTLVPHTWPTDDPDLFRPGEETGWAAMNSPYVIRPSRFGHGILQAGTKETAAPGRLFELIAREDFTDGTRGRFTKGQLEDGGYMGLPKALRFKTPEGATTFQAPQPLKSFREVQLLAALKAENGRNIYWHTFGKIYGSQKCCARQVTTLCRDFVPVHPYFTYCDGAGRMDYSSLGQADPYYAGFTKHLGWYSEPSIGRIQFAGPTQWAVCYVRMDELFTQNPHCKGIDADKDEIPGWFFHPAGNYDILIGEAVMFRGKDVEPPARVSGLRLRQEGGKAILSWDRSADNTMTVWYRVLAGQGKDRQVLAEVPALSVELPAEKVRGADLCVQAVDFFENASEPSQPIRAK